jgi:hypothetical protein
MNGKFLLFGRGEIENSLVRFADRKISEQRRDERRLAEQRTTKHRIQARKSCIADARTYRIARRLPVLPADASFANGVGYSICSGLVAFYLGVRAMARALDER